MSFPALAQRRRVLFTMLTTLSYRYPPGREPAVIAGIPHYLAGWPGVGLSSVPPGATSLPAQNKRAGPRW